MLKFEVNVCGHVNLQKSSRGSGMSVPVRRRISGVVSTVAARLIIGLVSGVMAQTGLRLSPLGRAVFLQNGNIGGVTPDSENVLAFRPVRSGAIR